MLPKLERAEASRGPEEFGGILKIGVWSVGLEEQTGSFRGERSGRKRRKKRGHDKREKSRRKKAMEINMCFDWGKNPEGMISRVGMLFSLFEEGNRKWTVGGITLPVILKNSLRRGAYIQHDMAQMVGGRDFLYTYRPLCKCYSNEK